MRALVAAAALLALTPVAAALRSPRPATPAIVTVRAGDRVATGFAREGRIVTVAHVLAAGDALVASGRPAAVLAVDGERDLAILTSRAPASPSPAVGGVHVLVRRDGRTVALPTEVRRRMSARVRDAATGATSARRALELTVDVEAGDSGAPVVAPGRVLGVVFARSADRPHTAYAVTLP